MDARQRITPTLARATRAGRAWPTSLRVRGPGSDALRVPARRGVLRFAAPFLLCAALVAGDAARPEPAGIAWRADRPLTWADFAGPVARRTAPENVAITAASLGWAYEYELERVGGVCTYRITAIHASAVFHPDRSWSKPAHRTDRVLAHEQGHFDLTQVHKLIFESLTRDEVGVARPCTGRSSRRSAQFAEADVERRLGPIYEAVWQQHTRAQETYDADTGHGTNAAAQQAWSTRIRAGLRGGGWDALAAL